MTRISRSTPPLRSALPMPSMASSRLVTWSSTNQLNCSIVMSGGSDREIGDRLARGRFLLHEGLEDAVRKLAADLVDRVLHFVHRLIDVGPDLELDDGVGGAFAGGRADAADAGQGANRGFHLLRDLVLDLARGSTRLADAGNDDRKLDVRIVLHVHAHEADDARQRQADEEHDRDDRVADRPGRDVPEVHTLNPSCTWISSPGAGAARFRPD